MGLPSARTALLLVCLVSTGISALVCCEPSAEGTCTSPGQCQAEQGSPSAGADQQHTKATAADHSSRPSFPSSNEARNVTGKQLHDLLMGAGNSSSVNLVVLFYLSTCPHSNAMRPVFECLPAFFPVEVQFVGVSYSNMSLMALMTHGLHALPVLQVNTRGRKYRYSGKHWLGPMLHFVAKALGQEPLASLEVAQLCSAGQQQQQQPTSAAAGRRTAGSAATTGDGSVAAAAAAGSGSCINAAAGWSDVAGEGSNACSTAAAAAAADGTAGAGNALCSDDEQQQHQQQELLSVCGNWSCPRWDGEVTAEELTDQQHALLYYCSVVFLVCRALWWAWQRWRRRQRQQSTAAAAVAPGAAETAVHGGSSSSSVAAGTSASVVGDPGHPEPSNGESSAGPEGMGAQSAN